LVYAQLRQRAAWFAHEYRRTLTPTQAAVIFALVGARIVVEQLLTPPVSKRTRAWIGKEL
jgi:hypothetical protein